MPVGGSRHYGGPGLGEVAAWHCPSCGAENQGPISQGCALCGAGKPGTRVDAPPPPPPVEDNAFTRWLQRHPDATLGEAFTAGYVEGMRDARRQQLAAQQPQQLAPEGKVGRTIVAALQFFADQVLVNEPEEIASGEWLSAQEVAALIRQLQQQETARA